MPKKPRTRLHENDGKWLKLTITKQNLHLPPGALQEKTQIPHQPKVCAEGQLATAKGSPLPKMKLLPSQRLADLQRKKQQLRRGGEPPMAKK